MKLIVDFRIAGIEPCPWTVPKLNAFGGAHHTKKSALHAGVIGLLDYQKLVRERAVDAMAELGTTPWEGPVKLVLRFYARHPDPDMAGKLWTAGVKFNPEIQRWAKADGHGYAGRNNPDLTNLVKSTEDGLVPIEPATAKKRPKSTATTPEEKAAAKAERRASLKVRAVLQGVAFHNDVQVRIQDNAMVYGVTSGVRVRVYGVEPQDIDEMIFD